MKMPFNLTIALLALLPFVALTTQAADDAPRRGCRVGTPSEQFAPHRAQWTAGSENPYMGNRRQLVVLASFQDYDFAEGHDATLATWNNIFNTEGYHEAPFTGSVHDYFLAQSYGQFNLVFDLMLVELPGPRSKYQSTYSNDENSQYMVDDIVDKLETEGIDWSLYDWDGDAFVDQLLIVFAGKGMNDGGGSGTIWPHQWWLSQHLDLETADPTDHRSYRTVSSGDKTYYVDCYCCVQEMPHSGEPGLTFGTICHEYSHCFGFPDFYNGSTQYVGQWDLMDYGNNNGDGLCPCGYSAHERMLMGWLAPKELTRGTTITEMAALSDEPQAYLVRNNGAENEYYIVENRQQKGWDEKLPGSGVVIFHVDYDKALWESPSASVNTSGKKRYTIFPANNSSKNSAQKFWAYPYGMTNAQGKTWTLNDELTNTSAPAATLNNANADGRLLMSKPITQIAVDVNGMASFVFMDSEVTPVDGVPAMQPSPEHWYSPDGRQQGKKATRKGIYIHQGKKVVAGESK